MFAVEQQMWQLAPCPCGFYVEFEAHVRIFSTGDDESSLSIDYVSPFEEINLFYISSMYDLSGYAEYTIISATFWPSCDNTGYLRMIHKGSVSEFVSHYMVDSVHIYCNS